MKNNILQINCLRSFLIFLIVLCTCFSSIVHSQNVNLVKNPYADVNWTTYNQYKSNYHTHTTNSDGSQNPSTVINEYGSKGYEILSITDHNVTTWTWPHNNYGMLAIKGNEYSSSHHMNAMLNFTNSSSNLENGIPHVQTEGGIIQINHPGRYNSPSNWSWYIPWFRDYSSCVVLEVFNQGDRYSSDRQLWDNINENYFAQSGEFAWGSSNDDKHTTSHLYGNFNFMLMPDLTEAAWKESMEKGAFYFSYEPGRSGNADVPRINDIVVDNNTKTITISGTGYNSIQWIGPGTTVVATGNVFDYTSYTDEPFIRAVLDGSNGDSYTQPFGFETVIDNPVCTITAPSNGTHYNSPQTISIEADATDPNGTVSSVEFFVNGSSVGYENTEPYAINWTMPGPGDYDILAVATDDDGLTGSSSVISISVSNGDEPTVSITSPTDGQYYSGPQTISIQADAADTDGTITSVEFFVDGNSVGTDYSFPHSINWTIPTGGNYEIHALATDDSGNETVSSTVSIIVGVIYFSSQISSGDDDAEQRVSDGGMDLTSTDIELGDDPGYNEDQIVGLLFRNIDIPQGATITSAYITFETDEVDTESTSVTIKADDSDNAADFTSSDNNLSNRMLTSAAVNWNNIPAWNTVSEKHQSPDITSVIQEIVDRSGWTEFNKIAIIITGTGSRTAESYNGEPANAASLHIEFETGSSNYKPVAAFSHNTACLTTTFTDESTDADGTVDSWLWDFGDGNTSSDQNPVHTYNTSGNYDVVLTVTDNEGATDDETQTIVTTTINTYYADSDSDGYGDANTSTQDCTAPNGYVTDNTDCDDTNGAVNPGAIEDCFDGIDNNCDGVTDCPPTVDFAMLGDFGDGSNDEEAVANIVNSWNSEFIVTAGDNRYGSIDFDEAVGQYYCSFLEGAESGSYCNGNGSIVNAFFPTTGNHDYTDGGGINEYLAYFDLPGAGVATSGTSGNELYYDVIHGIVHFFMIDSYTDLAVQQSWLQAQLAASTATWKVVIFHHAPYSSGSHGSTTNMQWPFASWGADVVMSGHDHTYERIHQNGIVYFVNGLGGRSIYSFGTPIPGSQVRYNADYGAMKISADTASMQFQFINTSGTVVDDHTITKNNNPGPGGTLDIPISGSNDDVEQKSSDGTMYSTSSDIELGDDPSYNGEQSEGLLFRNVNIPQGATITSAYITFETDEVSTDPTSITFYGHDTDDAPDFSTSNYDLTNRTVTSASVNWNNIPSWNTVSEKHQSPEIASIIQEIVDRPGWTEYNKIAIIITGTGTRTAEAYDGEPANAASLHIEYSTEVVNDPPTASFSHNTSCLTTTFTDESTDSDGTVDSWLWDFGDGNTSTEQNPVHIYASAGNYNVILTVTDDDGDTDDDSQIITTIALNTYYADTDSDGYGDAGSSTQACSAPAGFVSDNTDCDDTNGAINPGATEVCDGEDNNCDGNVDEGVLITYYADTDSDGYGDAGSTTQACSAPAGFVSDDTDCDDTNGAIYPGATEICDGEDNNCDGNVDEGVLNTYYADTDSDGYGDAGSTTQACSAPAGYVSDDTDCDDTNGAINPGATEVCDGEDNNCDGNVDEGVLITYYADTDSDGYGDAVSTTQACSAPTGYVSDATDCDDTNGEINPGATEVCDGIDNNCDGFIDEGLAFDTYFIDVDSDGYGDPEYFHTGMCTTSRLCDKLYRL